MCSSAPLVRLVRTASRDPTRPGLQGAFPARCPVGAGVGQPLPAHRPLGAPRAGGSGVVEVVPRPRYAPEPNPVEALRAHLTDHRAKAPVPSASRVTVLGGLPIGDGGAEPMPFRGFRFQEEIGQLRAERADDDGVAGEKLQ